MGLTLRRPCACGHAKDSHEHYRRGSDCSACGCTSYAGRLEVTLRVGRLRPVGQVVLPDEPYVVEGPWVRPTHTGCPSPTVELGPYVVPPRKPDEVVVAERAAQA